MDSLNPEKHKYDAILIDESEQVFAHLISSTLRDKRSAAYLRLCHYIREARHVYLLDADLGMVTLQSTFEVGLKPNTPFRVVINQPTQQPRGDTYLYASGEQLTVRLCDAVAAGEKCYVATNSKNEVKRLAELLKKVAPEARVVSIDSDNSQSEEIQKLIAKRFLRHAFLGSPQFSRVKQIMAQSVDVSDWSQKTYPKQRKDLASILKRLGTPFDTKATGLEREVQALAMIAPAVLRPGTRVAANVGEAKAVKTEAAQAEPPTAPAVNAATQPLSLGRRVQVAWRVLLNGHA